MSHPSISPAQVTELMISLNHSGDYVRPLIQSLSKENLYYQQERVQMPKPGLERFQQWSEHRLHALNWAL